MLLQRIVGRTRCSDIPTLMPSVIGYADSMSVTKIVRDAGSAALTRATWGGSQNFLGARWVEHLVDSSPVQIRERVALRLLSFSPHYFYNSDLRGESERNRRSRQALVDALVTPHLTKSAHVLDYGCGPGYMASAVAERVDHVDAVDISRGVLACAKVLNGRPNISYIRPDELVHSTRMVDLAYSFAVVQHLKGTVLADMLTLLASKLRQDGILLLHFAVPGGHGGWRTEAEWNADQSVAGRAKIRYGLNCFGRSVAEMEALVSSAGFSKVVVRPLSGSISIPGDDDIVRQHWLVARRQ
jgi:SAM-dependent methyltransferase